MCKIMIFITSGMPSILGRAWASPTCQASVLFLLFDCADGKASALPTVRLCHSVGVQTANAGCTECSRPISCFTFARSAGPPGDQNLHICVDWGHVEYDRRGSPQ